MENINNFSENGYLVLKNVLSRKLLKEIHSQIYKTILKYKAGFVSRDNASDFSKILFKFHMLNKEEIKKFSKNSLLCFKENFDLMSKKNSLSSYIKSEIKKMIKLKKYDN